MGKLLNILLRPFGLFAIKASDKSELGWRDILSSFHNTANEKVTNESAMTVSALYACVRNVSEDIAKMPLKTYRRAGDYKYEEPTHPAARLLQYQANSEMTAMSFREMLNAQAMGWGNAYAEIERDIYGVPVALWPLRPDMVTMYRDDAGRMFYRILLENGGTADLWADDVLHLHGLGFDGVSGYNVIQYASQSIGAAIGMDKFAGSFFANGLHQSGVLTHPGRLSTKAQDALRNQFNDEYGGASQAHKLLIAEEGMTFAANTIDPKASQMIETRQFTVAEFCRWTRVPPHKVADLTRATFSNIEEQNIDYVQDGLLGWCKRWEQALWWKLLSPDDKRNGIYFEHVVEGLLRGNTQARYEAYSTLWDRGVLSINEIRGKENMNPVDGGDVHYIPMNFAPLGAAESMGAVVTDIAERLASREMKELEKHAKHASEDLPQFHSWLDEFYAKHDMYITEAIEPLAVSIDPMLLSLRGFIENSIDPISTLDYWREHHVNYIADNIKRVL